MIKSMTGYGKGIADLGNGRLTVEIKTLNSKSCDINLKSSLLPKDKELEVRAHLSEVIQRGTVDVFLTWEANAAENAKQVNMDIARGYLAQAKLLGKEIGATNMEEEPAAAAMLLNAILRLPDVIEVKKQDIITDENWPLVSAAFDEALAGLNAFRSKEGEALYKDVTSRVQLILDLDMQVEKYEAERIDTVKAKIQKALDDLKVSANKERFEQEMIYYLEKYDINEEKVRLRQHCKYFFDTIDGESYPGKKLGFIIQEMGREINTTGSKANHAEIQKLVVRMKDELEKVREQSMNIL